MNADEIAAARAALEERVEVFCEKQREEVERLFCTEKPKAERESNKKRVRAFPSRKTLSDYPPKTAAELKAIMYPIPEGAPDPFEEDFPPVKTEDEQLGRPA